MTPRKFYTLFFTAIFAGYAWLGLSLGLQASNGNEGPGVCLFKGITGIPCPSCGSTRSVMHILHGDFDSALMINPMGGIIFLILLVGPLWLAYDLLLNHQTMFTAYKQMEDVIRKKSVAIPLILLVSANWAWNIIKGL